MKDGCHKRVSESNVKDAKNIRNKDLRPNRREFLGRMAGAGLALAGSRVTAWADHHGHPTPNSLTYLDRRMYISNMELLAHFLPGQVRNGKMQLMSIGNRRYMFQQGDVIDISDVRK